MNSLSVGAKMKTKDQFMKVRVKKIYSFVLGFGSLAMLSCSQNVPTSTLSIVIPPTPSKQFSRNLLLTDAPSEISDFDCLFVNVMGEGIDTSSDYSGYASVADSVSSLGTVALSQVSSLFAPEDGASVNLDVAVGADRIVSLMAVKGTVSCGSPTANALNDSDEYAFVTEIARESVDISDSAVTEVVFTIGTNGYESKADARLTETPLPPSLSSGCDALNSRPMDTLNHDNPTLTITDTFNPGEKVIITYDYQGTDNLGAYHLTAEWIGATNTTIVDNVDYDGVSDAVEAPSGVAGIQATCTGAGGCHVGFKLTYSCTN